MNRREKLKIIGVNNYHYAYDLAGMTDIEFDNWCKFIKLDELSNEN